MKKILLLFFFLPFFSFALDLSSSGNIYFIPSENISATDIQNLPDGTNTCTITYETTDPNIFYDLDVFTTYVRGQLYSDLTADKINIDNASVSGKWSHTSFSCYNGIDLNVSPGSPYDFKNGGTCSENTNSSDMILYSTSSGFRNGIHFLYVSYYPQQYSAFVVHKYATDQYTSLGTQLRNTGFNGTYNSQTFKEYLIADEGFEPQIRLNGNYTENCVQEGIPDPIFSNASEWGEQDTESGYAPTVDTPISELGYSGDDYVIYEERTPVTIPVSFTSCLVEAPEFIPEAVSAFIDFDFTFVDIPFVENDEIQPFSGVTCLLYTVWDFAERVNTILTKGTRFLGFDWTERAFVPDSSIPDTYTVNMKMGDFILMLLCLFMVLEMFGIRIAMVEDSEDYERSLSLARDQRNEIYEERGYTPRNKNKPLKVVSSKTKK